MGSLIVNIPYSEITATIEILDRLGVERDDLKRFRTSVSMQGKIASLLTAERQASEELKLLTPIAQFHVIGTAKFAAPDHYRVDTGRKANVKIAFIGDNFANNFVSKVEEDVPAGVLNINKLLRDSLDAPIITELGERHETYLADLWAFLEKQPGGEKGFLMNNGYANIFYIRDIHGKLWAVYADWSSDDGGWHLRAGSVGPSHRWLAGDQVVSR